MKKYRNFTWIEWFILTLFNVGLVYFFFSTYSTGNIYVLIVLLYLIDLIEIKSMVKFDISILSVNPQPFHRLFFNIVLSELFSIKLVPILVAGLFFSFLENTLRLNFFLGVIFLSQIILTIFLYHITYRYTKYSTLIRYIFLVPLILLFIGKSYVLKINIDRLLAENYFLIGITGIAIMIFIIAFFGLKSILHTIPFMKDEHLKKSKNNVWSW